MVRALAHRPMRLAELTDALNGPSQAAVRARLEALTKLGAVTKKGSGVPYAVWSELNDVGRDVLRLADEVDEWLTRAPQGPLTLGSAAGERAVKALVGGWDSTVIQTLAAGPLTLVALNEAIEGLSYPALERRLVAMRKANLVESADSGAGRPLRTSAWGREAVGPLLAAADFERAHMAELTRPLEPIDTEAAALLARDA